MALTIKEQLDIVSGTVAPANYSLNQYIEQVAVDTAQDFMANSKTVNSETNYQASQYLYNMKNSCRDISLNVTRFTDHLKRILIAIYADTGSMATVLAATDDQWVAFLQANMLKSIEALAGVVKQEKDDYASIA